MKVRGMVLALAGFLAGVAFVISCGEGARSAAEDILSAIGVTFDNSGTGLQATNVQELGSELDIRVSALETSVGLIPPPADIQSLFDRITALETAVGAIPAPANLQPLYDAISALEARLALAEAGLSGDATRISSLESGYSRASIDISLLAGRMATAETGLSSLNSRMGTAETGMTSLGSRMGAAETSLASLGSRMSSAETGLTSLNGRVTGLEGDVSDILVRLDEDEDNIGHLINFTGYYDYATGTSWMQLASVTGVNGTAVHDSFGVVRMRCLKLAVSYTSDTGQANIYEIEARMLGATNYALNATATALSSEGGDPTRPGQAVDGDSETRWSSDRANPGPASVAVPHWIVLDFGESRSIDEIAVNAGSYGEDYIVYGRTPSGSDPCGN